MVMLSYLDGLGSLDSLYKLIPGTGMKKVPEQQDKASRNQIGKNIVKRKETVNDCGGYITSVREKRPQCTKNKHGMDGTSQEGDTTKPEARPPQTSGGKIE